MKKIIPILCGLLILSASQAWAEYGLTSTIVTDKMVYAPGDVVYTTIYIENNNKFEKGVLRFPQGDYTNPPAANLHSDAELSGGGTFYRKITDLPVREAMGISHNATRPYAAFAFELVDATGTPLPPGYYAISHTGISFYAGVDGQQMILRVVDAAHVIFIAEQPADSGAGDSARLKELEKRMIRIQSDVNAIETKTTRIGSDTSSIKNLGAKIHALVEQILARIRRR